MAYVDLFRALGILLMIMGHVRFGQVFDKWIHAFHMPMFFFVTGWFYRHRPELSLSQNCCRKVRNLIAPYLIFAFFLWFACVWIIPEYRSWRPLFHILWENTFKIPVEGVGISPVPGALWFLTALFFAETIYMALDRLFSTLTHLHLAVLSIVLLGMSIPSVTSCRLPWGLDAAFVGIGFLHAARMLKQSRFQILTHLSLWQTIGLGAVNVVLILVSPKVNMRTAEYGWWLPFWVNALCAILVGWNLARYLDCFLEKSQMSQGLSRILSGIGRNSIVYLCLNQIVILAMANVGVWIGVRGALSRILVLCFSMMALFALEKLICDTRLRVIIQKT